MKGVYLKYSNKSNCQRYILSSSDGPIVIHLFNKELIYKSTNHLLNCQGTKLRSYYIGVMITPRYFLFLRVPPYNAGINISKWMQESLTGKLNLVTISKWMQVLFHLPGNPAKSTLISRNLLKLRSDLFKKNENLNSQKVIGLHIAKIFTSMAQRGGCFHLREQVRASFQLDGGPTCQEKKISKKTERRSGGIKPKTWWSQYGAPIPALCRSFSSGYLLCLLRLYKGTLTQSYHNF